MKEQISLIIREIVEVTDDLYQEKLNRGYSKLNSTLGKLMEIADKLHSLAKESRLEFDEHRFLGNLTRAMKAMEDKDSVLLSDILTYDIGGQLLEMIES